MSVGMSVKSTCVHKLEVEPHDLAIHVLITAQVNLQDVVGYVLTLISNSSDRAARPVADCRTETFPALTACVCHLTIINREN